MRHILIAIFALAVAADISGLRDGDWSTDVTARGVS